MAVLERIVANREWAAEKCAVGERAIFELSGRLYPRSSGPIIPAWLAQPDNKPRAAPQFYVVTVDQALGLGDGLGIIGTNKGVVSHKMTVDPDGVCSIFRHPRLLIHRMLFHFMTVMELKLRT